MSPGTPHRRDADHVPSVGEAAYPLRSGNAVRPLVDGESAFRRICQAVEAARHSVWVTVAFLERDVPMPDDRGSFFDVLDTASRRGLDVRVLFWREPRLREIEPDSTHFEGNAEDRSWLAARGSRFLARWDRLPDGYCQHQKSWLVDAGEAGEVAFVGGINPVRASMSPPGHDTALESAVHDVYLELAGPASTDVHHNFVQRWNEASEREAVDGSWPDAATAGELAFPAFVSPPAGEVPVQLTRTVLPARYTCDEATPGGKPYDIARGENSIRTQYLEALGAARRSIYLENQAIGSPDVVDALRGALKRGVEVVFLVPGNAHPAFTLARRNPRLAFFFEKLEQLGHFENFILVALAGSPGGGRYDEIYVHAKVAMVDDAWCTIGSTNVADRSFVGDTELNASFWHAATARALRIELLKEHLGHDTSALDDVEALCLYRRVALTNRDRRTCWEPLEGLAYAIDPRDYGV